MTTEKLATAFSALTPEEQAVALVRYGWELTLVGRDAYACKSPQDGDPVWLHHINENQHQVAQQALAVLDGSPRYPDSMLVEMIVEAPDLPEMTRQLQFAFQRALDFAERRSSTKQLLAPA